MKSTRRNVMGLAASGLVFGQAHKGPVVWLGMDQKELDDAYTQSVYAPNARQITRRYATNSELTRNRIGPPRRFAYGSTAIEGLDVFASKAANAPVVMFVHGGAWRGEFAKDYAFLAEVFVKAGAHYVVPDFINVDEAGGSLTPMADQIRRAIQWVYRNARSFGGDPNRLYLTGHSSGAHLAGVALITDWQNEFNLPADVIKGALCCSGIFDLKPVRLSVRGSYIKFTDEMEQAMSPQRHLERLACPVVLAYGTLETPEFQRQTKDFATAAKAAGKQVQLVVGEGYNHFELLETMGSPYGILGRRVLELIV